MYTSHRFHNIQKSSYKENALAVKVAFSKNCECWIISISKLFNTTLSSSKARMERTMAYSRMVLNTMKMQVMMNVSMAFSLDSPEDGALERTLLKTLTRTRRRMTRSDIRPGTTWRGDGGYHAQWRQDTFRDRDPPSTAVHCFIVCTEWISAGFCLRRFLITMSYLRINYETYPWHEDKQTTWNVDLKTWK